MKIVAGGTCVLTTLLPWRSVCLLATFTSVQFRPFGTDLPDKQNENCACVLCENCPSCQSVAGSRRRVVLAPLGWC
jgi:hypothetical protein